MRVLAISCITNMAAGVLKKKLDHREVLEVAEKVREGLIDVLGRLIAGRGQAGVKKTLRRRPAAGPTAALWSRWPATPARAPTRPSRSSRWARRCLCAPGEIVTGCNIENASYGLTLCAERVAVFKAVSEGFRDFEAIAVVADAPRLTAPCGPCRQILWEFCGDIWVHMARAGRAGRALKPTSYRMSELLPLPFDGRNL